MLTCRSAGRLRCLRWIPPACLSSPRSHRAFTMSLLQRRRSVPALVFIALLLSGAAALSRPAEAPAPAGPAKLAVLVVFDQMRGDYLTRWESLFGEGGFRRMIHDGAFYTDCHYPYAFTVTGAGHASLATGSSPRTHGIVGNEWYDRTLHHEEVACVTSSRYRPIPPEQSGKDSASERRLARAAARANAGGRTKEGHRRQSSRLVSLSFKDRGRLLPGGQHPDACYWFETATGRFVTSTYYRDRSHPWVESFNARSPADAWFNKPWQYLRPTRLREIQRARRRPRRGERRCPGRDVPASDGRRPDQARTPLLRRGLLSLPSVTTFSSTWC